MPQQAYTAPRHVVLRAQQREGRLRSLGYTGYGDYLNSPTWKRIRTRYAEERPWICNVCGVTERLQLHHRTYERVGHEHLDDLMPLCEPCHAMVHALERRGDAGLDFEGVIDEARAIVGRKLLADQAEAISTEREFALQQARAARESLPLDARIRHVRQAARVRHINISSNLRVLERSLRKRPHRDAVVRVVERIERQVYGF